MDCTHDALFHLNQHYWIWSELPRLANGNKKQTWTTTFDTEGLLKAFARPLGVNSFMEKKISEFGGKIKKFCHTDFPPNS